MPRLASATVRPLLVLLFCSLSLQKADAATQADSARVLESQGEFALALAAYEAISVRAGDDSTVTDALALEALRARLRLYVRLRNDAAAEALLRQHASLFEPESRFILQAVLALRRNDPERALVTLEGVRLPGAVGGFAHKLRAEAFYDLQRWSDARDAVADAGRSVLPLEMRRRLRVIESHAAFATGDITRLRQLAPQLGRDARTNDRTGLILCELARVLLTDGDAAQAREWLLELLDARPTPADTAFALLQQQLDAGTWPASNAELLRLAQHEIRRGRHAEARTRLRALLAHDGLLSRRHTAEAWVMVSETYQRQGQDSRCLETLAQNAAQIVDTPSEPEMLRLQARSKRRLGDEDGAIALYEDLAQRFPNHPRADDALYEVGWRYEIRGDFRKAEDVYASLQRRFPNSRLRDDAALREGLSAFRDARWEAALGHFRNFTVRYPNSTLIPRAIYWRLWIQQARGDTTRARALRERLRQEFPLSYFTTLAARSDLRASARALDDAAPRVSDITGRELAHRSHVKYLGAIETLRASARLEVPGSFEEAARLWRFCLDHGLAAEARWETRRLEQQYARHTGALLELLEANYRRGAHEHLVRVSYLISLRVARPGLAEALEILRHPAPFSVTLAETARRHGVSHALVLAMMRRESAFDPGVDSRAGARGLMQVMPHVGRRLASQLGRAHMHPDELYDPVWNMTLGCRLFSQELEQAQGRVEQALAAYNAGSDRAARWIERLGPQEPRELYLDVAEYVETRTYLEHVLGSGEVYRRVYELP